MCHASTARCTRKGGSRKESERSVERLSCGVLNPDRFKSDSNRPSHGRRLRERFCRSVPVGRSRFSRCCHLIIDLSFHLERWKWAWRLTQSPELGVWAFVLPSSQNALSCGGQRHSARVVQRFVRFSSTRILANKKRKVVQSPDFNTYALH
jgi:hypothetical protein